MRDSQRIERGDGETFAVTALEYNSTMEPEPDVIMHRAGEGIAASQRGERAEAREIFDELWRRIEGDAGDPLHRCAIAHWMADVQDDPEHELVWDLRALDAADSVTDSRVHAAGMAGPAGALYPSLHLNLADVYLRLGEPALAQHHVNHGNAAADTLPDDGYGTMVREGLARIEHKLAGTT